MSENKKYFAAKLLSPRPSFPFDMSDEEKIIMQQHSEFWRELLDSGKAVVTGPVLDPEGAYGFGIIIAGSVEDAELLLKDDPARKISSYRIYEMLASLPSKKQN